MTKRNSVILLITGFLMGTAIAKLFIPSNLPIAAHNSTVHNTVVKLQKQAAVEESLFQQAADSLNRKGAAINIDLKNRKSALKKVQIKNEAIQVEVQHLLTQQSIVDTGFCSDTSSANLIKNEVNKLLLFQTEKDSTQDAIAQLMEQQLANKEDFITLQQQQYISLKTAFNSSLEQQQILELENNRYNKYFKRQKLRQKIKSVGLIIISIVTAKQILK